MELSVRDAKMMYEGSILMLGKDLVYVSNIDEDTSTSYDIFTRVAHYIPRKEMLDKFKPIPFRLGYFQAGKSAAYISRQPYRQFKVGIHKSNISVSIPTNCEEEYMLVRGEVNRVFPFFEGFKAFVEDKYPTFRHAAELLEDGSCRSVAMDRQFALSKDFRVWFRNKPVGVWQGTRVKLEDSFQYLSSVMGWCREFA